MKLLTMQSAISSSALLMSKVSSSSHSGSTQFSPNFPRSSTQFSPNFPTLVQFHYYQLGLPIGSTQVPLNSHLIFPYSQLGLPIGSTQVSSRTPYWFHTSLLSDSLLVPHTIISSDSLLVPLTIYQLGLLIGSTQFSFRTPYWFHSLDLVTIFLFLHLRAPDGIASLVPNPNHFLFIKLKNTVFEPVLSLYIYFHV